MFRDCQYHHLKGRLLLHFLRLRMFGDPSEGPRVGLFSLGIGGKQHRPRTTEGRFQMHHSFAPSQQVYQSSETAMTSLQPGPH